MGTLPDSLQWLVKYQDAGVTWNVQDVPIKSIALDRAKQYQARLAQFIPDVVDRYATAMKNGAKFPPIVLVKVSDGSRSAAYEIIDGVHRTMAAGEISAKTVTALVIPKLDHEVRVSMVAECNSTHGVPYTTNERVLHALLLVDNGYTQIRAAEAVGVLASRVGDAIQVRSADLRANNLMIEHWDMLKATHRKSINRLHDDLVFTAVAELTIKASPTLAELNDLVIEANSRRSTEGGLEVVTQYQERLGLRAAVKTSDGRKVPDRARLMAALANTEKWLDKVDLSPMDVIRMTEIARKLLARAEQFKGEIGA